MTTELVTVWRGDSWRQDPPPVLGTLRSREVRAEAARSGADGHVAREVLRVLHGRDWMTVTDVSARVTGCGPMRHTVQVRVGNAARRLVRRGLVARRTSEDGRIWYRMVEV